MSYTPTRKTSRHTRRKLAHSRCYTEKSLEAMADDAAATMANGEGEGKISKNALKKQVIFFRGKQIQYSFVSAWNHSFLTEKCTCMHTNNMFVSPSASSSYALPIAHTPLPLSPLHSHRDHISARDAAVVGEDSAMTWESLHFLFIYFFKYLYDMR